MATSSIIIFNPLPATPTQESGAFETKEDRGSLVLVASAGQDTVQATSGLTVQGGAASLVVNNVGSGAVSISQGSGAVTANGRAGAPMVLAALVPQAGAAAPGRLGAGPAGLRYRHIVTRWRLLIAVAMTLAPSLAPVAAGATTTHSHPPTQLTTMPMVLPGRCCGEARASLEMGDSSVTKNSCGICSEYVY